MKRTVCLIMVMLLTTFCFASCGETTNETKITTRSYSDETHDQIADKELKKGTHHAEIVIKDYGTIKAELYADIAPITVTNFISLAKSGFYNGLTFHRIIKDFMMQGGDPLGTGQGGADKNIEGEFNINGHENTLEHTRGVLSMARSNDYNSGSSQFFIVQKDAPHLNGSYAGFGKVTSGMDIVDKICNNTPVTDANGTVLKENQPVIKTIKIID